MPSWRMKDRPTSTCATRYVWMDFPNTQLLQLVAKHCGSDAEFYLSHVIAKPPYSEYSIPWHQVSNMMRHQKVPSKRLTCQDYRKSSETLPCTVWIALDDANPENGAMACLPGHHTRVLEVQCLILLLQYNLTLTQSFPDRGLWLS